MVIKPAVKVTTIVIAVIAYIGFNVLLFYRFRLFSLSRSSTPLAKLKKVLSQKEVNVEEGSDGAPSEGFNLGKEKKFTLTTDIRNDIPQAVDLTIDPGLTKGPKPYSVSVSAYDQLGVNAVTITIPSHKQVERKQLTMVKGTAQDGIWKTDAELDYTGQPILFIIDVENSSARTTTEVALP